MFVYNDPVKTGASLLNCRYFLGIVDGDTPYDYCCINLTNWYYLQHLGRDTTLRTQHCCVPTVFEAIEHCYISALDCLTPWFLEINDFPSHRRSTRIKLKLIECSTCRFCHTAICISQSFLQQRNYFFRLNH